MNEETIKMIAMLYWLGYFIFLVVALYIPNSEGRTVRNVYTELSEETGVNLKVAKIVTIMLGCICGFIWPVWVIRSVIFRLRGEL